MLKSGSSFFAFLPIVLLPVLWLISLGFPQYSSLDLRRLPPNTLYLGQRSQSSFKSSLPFCFLIEPIEQMLPSAVQQVWEDCRKELFRGSSTLDGCSPETAQTQRQLKGSCSLLTPDWFDQTAHLCGDVKEVSFSCLCPPNEIKLCEWLPSTYFYLHFYFNQKLSWSEWRPPTELVCVFKRLCLSPRVAVYHRRFILVQGLVIVLFGHVHQREELKGLMRTFHLAHRWLKLCPILSWVLLSPFLAFLFWNMIIVVFEFSGDFCSVLHAVRGFF